MTSGTHETRTVKTPLGGYVEREIRPGTFERTWFEHSHSLIRDGCTASLLEPGRSHTASQPAPGTGSAGRFGSRDAWLSWLAAPDIRSRPREAVELRTGPPRETFAFSRSARDALAGEICKARPELGQGMEVGGWLFGVPSSWRREISFVTELGPNGQQGRGRVSLDLELARSIERSLVASEANPDIKLLGCWHVHPDDSSGRPGQAERSETDMNGWRIGFDERGGAFPYLATHRDTEQAARLVQARRTRLAHVPP